MMHQIWPFGAYFVLGSIGFCLSMYLFVYYINHSKKVKRGSEFGSKYFYSVGLLFVPLMFLSGIWTVSGLFSIIGLRDEITHHIPFITTFTLVLMNLCLLRFVKRTHEI